MDCLRSDLENCSFVKCPGNTASVLYEQYTKDLKELLDKHAPEVIDKPESPSLINSLLNFSEILFPLLIQSRTWV